MSGIRRHSQVSSTSSVEEDPKRCKTVDMDYTSMETLNNILDEKFENMRAQIKQDIINLYEEKLQSLETKIISLTEENDKQKSRIDDLTMASEMQEQTVEHLEKMIVGVKRHAVENEQYSRRENIRIMGLPEEQGENCVTKTFEWIRSKLHSDIKVEDIAIAHRVKGGTPRSMIVRFSSRSAKEQVIQKRRVLKASGITVCDDLCKEMFLVLNRARNDARVSNAWSWGGKIFAKLKTGNIIPIRYGETIDSVQST